MIAKILGILFLLALAGFGIQTWRASHYESKAAAFQSAVVTFQSAQKTNLATIVALQATNADWASKCAANEPEARSEADKATAFASRQHVTVERSIAALKVTYEHEPTVKAWADMPVPDAVVRSLQQQASGKN